MKNTGFISLDDEDGSVNNLKVTVNSITFKYVVKQILKIIYENNEKHKCHLKPNK